MVEIFETLLLTIIKSDCHVTTVGSSDVARISAGTGRDRYDGCEYEYAAWERIDFRAIQRGFGAKSWNCPCYVARIQVIIIKKIPQFFFISNFDTFLVLNLVLNKEFLPVCVCMLSDNLRNRRKVKYIYSIRSQEVLLLYFKYFVF